MMVESFLEEKLRQFLDKIELRLINLVIEKKKKENIR